MKKSESLSDIYLIVLGFGTESTSNLTTINLCAEATKAKVDCDQRAVKGESKGLKHESNNKDTEMKLVDLDHLLEEEDFEDGDDDDGMDADPDFRVPCRN